MKVAVVTGSTRGIGLGIARTLGGAGYAVVLNHLSNPKSAREAAASMKGIGHIIVKADVRKPAGARRLISAALRKWKRVDVLVNNIGDFFETPVADMDLDRWDEIYDSNVRTALHCTREALPAMRRQKSGVIVNLGGTAIQVARGNRRYAAYVMAKSALMIFTRSLAQAEAAAGIRVNMINPGYIRTYAYSPADVRELSAAVPAKRLGTVEDIGAAVEFLACDRASYITGAVLDVGGGLWV